jgi:hypothetical protein
LSQAQLGKLANRRKTCWPAHSCIWPDAFETFLGFRRILMRAQKKPLNAQQEAASAALISSSNSQTVLLEAPQQSIHPPVTTMYPVPADAAVPPADTTL